ncbi:hypothetical protein SAMN05216276_11762, partial [Streptosporangium subroseum]
EYLIFQVYNPREYAAQPATQMRVTSDLLDQYFQADRIGKLVRGWGDLVRRTVDSPDSAWGGWRLAFPRAPLRHEAGGPCW